MSEIELPPLPTPVAEWHGDQTFHLRSSVAMESWRDHDLHTADQMREYARQAVLQERERCAKVCEKIAEEEEDASPHKNYDIVASNCAAAIHAG